MPNLISDPRSTISLTVLVGNNSRGYWTVRDDRGLSGGFFVSRAEAVRYALLEAGNAPRAVIVTPDGLELDLAPAPHRWAASAIAWTKNYCAIFGTLTAFASFTLALLWQLHNAEPDLVLRAVMITSATVIGSLLVLGSARWLLTRMSRLCI